MERVFVMVLVVAAVMLGGTYYYVLRKQKQPAVWTPAEAVYHYVKEQFRLGYSEERIKRELAKLEWSKDLPQSPMVEWDSKIGSVEDQGALVLRFALGLIFVAQGLFFKLLYPSGLDIALYEQFQSAWGVSAEPHTLIVLAGVLQLLLGILLLAGLWTRIVAAVSALFLTQVTLLLSISGSPQLDMILLLSISLALIMLGGGWLSVDRYVGIP